MNNYSKIKKIFFAGIGGAGMSGIAEVLHNMGFVVSGSDIAENEPVKRLKKIGIDVFLGHDKKNIQQAETLVYSSAVNDDNVEVQEAKEMGIPVIPRAEMLAELMRLKFSIAVAGTHGKTSTTSMLASIFNEAGKDPTYVVGGKLKTEESGAKLGDSEYLIAEADESDGSFLRLFPTIAVITNIENDHLDHYGTIEKLLEAFTEFGNKIPFYGAVIFNSGCKYSNVIRQNLKKKAVSFGFDDNCDIRAEKIEQSAFNSVFDLIIRGKQYGKIKLNTTGKHNIENALAAIGAAFETGIDMKYIKAGLNNFYLPDRRFQVVFYNKKYLVIDDYAHHPTEIRATIEALKNGKYKRIIVIFQPHRFTRLKILMNEFKKAFTGVDKLVIARLYSANQEEIETVSGNILAEQIKSFGFEDVLYIDELDKISIWLEREIEEGDAVAFLSAGDLSVYAHKFAEIMERKEK